MNTNANEQCATTPNRPIGDGTQHETHGSATDPRVPMSAGNRGEWVPEGFVLVPRELTDQQASVALCSQVMGDDGEWAAMLVDRLGLSENERHAEARAIIRKMWEDMLDSISASHAPRPPEPDATAAQLVASK